MNDLHDDITDRDTIAGLRRGFAGVHYGRAASDLPRHRHAGRTAGLVAIAGATAVVATAVVVTSDGARSPALAWSPTPSAVSPADEAAAREACGSLTAAPADSTGIAAVTGMASASAGSAGSVIVGAGPAGGGVGAAEATISASAEGSATGEEAVAVSGDAAGGGGALEARPGQVVTAREGAPPGGLPEIDLPDELPPLVALDLRGTGGLATFADDEWVATCLLLRTGDGFERGVLTYEPASATIPSGVAGLSLVSASSTRWTDGRAIALVSGRAEGAASVVVEVPGQEPATASVMDGKFSLWWPGELAPGTGSLTALAADGTEVGSLAPLFPDLPVIPDAEARPVPAAGG